MEQLLKFLQKAKEATRNLGAHKSVHLVLGNESCDLDSTISAISLAYLIDSLKNESLDSVVIPVMNVEAKYFPLRTETNYLLKKYGIEPNKLVFKDEVKYQELLKLEVKTSLVDHHVLASNDKVLEDTVVEIFDHRPLNPDEICKNASLEQTIKTVGSCATLITHRILKTEILFEELAQLLYATIIYDTIGLDESCGKTFEEDLQVGEKLEEILKPQLTRKELFNTLWTIHNDTSSLTTKDLLYRDLKVVQGVPIPGLPMLVQDFLKRGDSHQAITSFAQDYQTSSLVIIGIDAGEEVKRDLALFSRDSRFKNVFLEVLKKSGSELDLKEVETSHENLICFRQGNIKLTRKFILPLVTQACTQTK